MRAARAQEPRKRTRQTSSNISCSFDVSELLVRDEVNVLNILAIEL